MNGEPSESSDESAPSKTEEEDVANVNRHRFLALVVGYNELARAGKTMGEKVYCRLAMDSALRAYREAGGKLDVTDDSPGVLQIKVGDGPMFVRFYEKDVELMRAAVAEYDAREEAQMTESEEILRDLLVSLPKCDRHRDRPATKAFQRGGDRYCDECGAADGHEREVPDYPRAEPVRRAVAYLERPR